jgi:MobA/MobL family
VTAAGFYHCSVKGIGRATGRSTVAAAAYRAGVRLVDERTGQVADYRARGGVDEQLIVTPANAPSWAHDLGRLLNEAEKAETRINGRVATEIVIALPHELPAMERRALAVAFVSWPVNMHGVAAHVSIHAPDRQGDPRNFHAHILLTHRALGPDGFGEIANTRTETRKRKGREVLEQLAGIAATPADIRMIRRQWEGAVNRAYEQAGLDVRVDHRSHEDRGLDAVPTIHLGPAATAMERRGEPSDRGAINREIVQHNAVPGIVAVPETEVTPIAAAPVTEKSERPAAAEKSREEGIPAYPAPPENAPAVITARPKIAPEPETPEIPVYDVEPLQEPYQPTITASHIEAEPPPAEPEREIEHGAAIIAGVMKPVGNFLGALGGARATLKGLFREAVRAITRQAEDEPPAPQRRRRGETEGEFRKLARNLSRRYHDMRADFRQRAAITSYFLTIPMEAYAAATAYLSGTLDQLNQLSGEIDSGDDYGENYDANSQRIFPQP